MRCVIPLKNDAILSLITIVQLIIDRQLSDIFSFLNVLPLFFFYDFAIFPFR